MYCATAAQARRPAVGAPAGLPRQDALAPVAQGCTDQPAARSSCHVAGIGTTPTTVGQRSIGVLEKTSQISSDGDRCSKPPCSRELRAGEVDKTHALVRDSRGPRKLACPTDSFNALGHGDVRACRARH